MPFASSLETTPSGIVLCYSAKYFGVEPTSGGKSMFDQFKYGPDGAEI